MKNKNFIWIIAVTIIVICYSLYIHNQRDKAINNGQMAIGTIQQINIYRSNTEIKVSYNYKGRIIYGSFYIGDFNDSLKKQTKVRLRVSRQKPSEYIEYIGVYKE